MNNWNRVHDGTSNPPRMDIQQSWWAMDNLGENCKEWTIEQKFEKIAEAGFDGISGFLPNPEEMDLWHKLLDRYKLSFSGLAYPVKIQDMIESVKLAKQFGRVQFLNSQVKDAFVIDNNAIQLLDNLLKVTEEANMPHFIETHRGTVTQDLIRTAGYVETLPQLRLMIDFSHYVVAGEMNAGTCEKAESLFDQLLERTSGIHVRISNGEQVQIDIGHEGNHPMVEHFSRWWRKGMIQWIKQAKPGELLPVVCELGPAIYSITRRTEQGQVVEISDRWEQALLFKRIFKDLWKQAQAGV